MQSVTIVVRLKSVSMQSDVLEKLINVIQIIIDQTLTCVARSRLHLLRREPLKQKPNDGTMAWDWLSPIPGTLYTQQYGQKHSGISPHECIAGDPPQSASPVVALEAGAAVRLEIGRRLHGPNQKRRYPSVSSAP